MSLSIMNEPAISLIISLDAPTPTPPTYICTNFKLEGVNPPEWGLNKDLKVIDPTSSKTQTTVPELVVYFFNSKV